MNNWFLILLTSAYLIINNPNSSHHKENIWIALFTITFGQIQVLEAMLWNELNSQNPDNSKIASITRYIPILLWAQPLVQSMGAYYSSGREEMLYASFIFLVILLHEWYLSFNEDSFTTTVSSDGHLLWHRKDKYGNDINIIGKGKFYDIMYIAGLVVPLLYISKVNLKIALIFFGFTSMLYSKVYTEAFSSYWCYIAVGYSLIAVLHNIVK